MNKKSAFTAAKDFAKKMGLSMEFSDTNVPFVASNLLGANE
jgi:hypothetical protein